LRLQRTKTGSTRISGRITPVPLHHGMDGRPVAVAVEDGARDAPVEDAVKDMTLLLRLPVAHRLAALYPALEAQALLVRRPALETDARRGVPVLEAILGQPCAMVARRINQLAALGAFNWTVETQV
jgi:hypothetical protein